MPATVHHPDPAPSTAIRAAQTRLLARLDRLAPTGEDARGDGDGERYAIGETFAVGGLGVIRRAYDHRLGRVIAVKTLQRSDPAAARRFALEARITARLQHPGIVPLHDIGRFPGGEPYYCMKLVDGRSLDRVIAGEPTLDGRLGLVEHVLAAADAIAYAHQRGVLHRDIKPANVLVGAHGETVVIDWGLAKDTTGTIAGELAAAGASGDGDVDLTGVGAIVGTLRYMPPEQARGEEVDARSDVYALGAVLFHVLAGRPPHARLDRAQLLERLSAGEVEALRPLVPAAPRELVAIAQKAMSSRPGDRYAGAAALAEDLRRFSAGLLVDAHRYQAGELLRLWLRRHRVLVTAAGAALAALTVASIVYLQRVEAARARATAAEAEAQRRANAAVLAQARGVLDDDPAEALRLLAEVDLSDPLDLRRARQVAVAAVARGAPVQVLRGHTRPIESVAALADGGLVSIDAGGAVWRWNLGTGRGEQVIDLRAPFGTVVAAAEAPVWAALAGAHGVVFRGEEPAEALDLSELPIGSGAGLQSHRWELSRGGETLAALATMGLAWVDPAAAYTWDLSARPAKFFALPFANSGKAAMSPDGRTIALRGAQRRAVLVRGGESTPLPALASPDQFSPSGSYLVDRGAALSLRDGTTRPLRGLTLAITLDDRALVLRRNAHHPPGSDDPQLALVDLSSGEEKWSRDLERSPDQLRAFARVDGGFVAADVGDRFAVRLGRRWTLWATAAGHVVRVLEAGDGGRAAFLPDGRFVATHNRDLWLWPAETAPDVPMDRWIAAAPDDSHALAFRRGETLELRVVRTRDGRTVRPACPLRLDWRGWSSERTAVVDGSGRALIPGASGGACLVDADGTSHLLAADEDVTVVALAESGDTQALGLADGTVLAFRGATPRRWRLDGEVAGLWATASGDDLIAHTKSGGVYGISLDDEEPLAIGTVQGAWRTVAPKVAIEPRGSGAVIALTGTDALAFYEGGVVTRRPVLLSVEPRLAFSPSGARLAVTIAGRGVLVLAGPDDPGQEFSLSEEIGELAFVAEDELAIHDERNSLLRLDTVLGEAIVLQREHNLRSLGLGLLMPTRGDGPPPVRSPGGNADAVPRDRPGLIAWLAARSR